MKAETMATLEKLGVTKALIDGTIEWMDESYGEDACSITTVADLLSDLDTRETKATALRAFWTSVGWGHWNALSESEREAVSEDVWATFKERMIPKLRHEVELENQV